MKYTKKQIENIKDKHDELRNILIDYGCKEYGDAIVDEISRLFEFPDTLTYYEEE